MSANLATAQQWKVVCFFFFLKKTTTLKHQLNISGFSNYGTLLLWKKLLSLKFQTNVQMSHIFHLIRHHIHALQNLEAD